MAFWMINALICSGTINLSEWESYVPSRAQKAQSTEVAVFDPQIMGPDELKSLGGRLGANVGG